MASLQTLDLLGEVIIAFILLRTLHPSMAALLQGTFLLDQGLTILITVANGEEGGRGGCITTGVGSKEGRSVGFSRKKPAKKGTMGDSKAVEK